MIWAESFPGPRGDTPTELSAAAEWIETGGRGQKMVDECGGERYDGNSKVAACRLRNSCNRPALSRIRSQDPPPRADAPREILDQTSLATAQIRRLRLSERNPEPP